MDYDDSVSDIKTQTHSYQRTNIEYTQIHPFFCTASIAIVETEWEWDEKKERRENVVVTSIPLPKYEGFENLIDIDSTQQDSSMSFYIYTNIYKNTWIVRIKCFNMLNALANYHHAFPKANKSVWRIWIKMYRIENAYMHLIWVLLSGKCEKKTCIFRFSSFFRTSFSLMSKPINLIKCKVFRDFRRGNSIHF